MTTRRDWRLPRDVRAEVRVPYVLRESAPTAFTIEQIESLSRCKHEAVVETLRVLLAEGQVEHVNGRIRWVTLK